MAACGRRVPPGINVTLVLVGVQKLHHLGTSLAPLLIFDSHSDASPRHLSSTEALLAIARVEINCATN